MIEKWRVVSRGRTTATLSKPVTRTTRSFGGLIQASARYGFRNQLIASMPVDLFKLLADNLRNHKEQGDDYDMVDAERVMEFIRGRHAKIQITHRVCGPVQTWDAKILEILP